MPKIDFIFLCLALLFIFSCETLNKHKADQDLTTERSEAYVAPLDTTLQEGKITNTPVDWETYKDFVEDPANGYIKSAQGSSYTLEVMYRPPSYESILSGDFDQKTYKKNFANKSTVLAFTCKVTSTSASALPQSKPVYTLKLLDDSTGAYVEPVYFLQDHKLGQVEVYYAVFDRQTIAQTKSDLLNLIWDDGTQQIAIKYPRRIVKENLIDIRDAK